MTKDQFKTLSARIYVDEAFRQAFASSPRAAAQQLGITLTDDETKQLTQAAEAIKNIGTAADKRLWQGDKAFIPLTPIKPPTP